MSELVVMNPSTGYSEDLGFNPNWSYGSPQPVGDNMSYARPRRGAAIARETGTMGHTIEMTFVDCTWAKVQWIRQLYQQFKRGYFTVIDYDGGGREYVGRFTKAPVAVHTGNLKYTIQGLTFEEVQGARMRNYPSDWANDAYFLYAVDDQLSPLINTMLINGGVTDMGGGMSYVSSDIFVLQQTPAAVLAGISVNDPTSYEMFNVDGNPATFAQAEYVGYGFQASFRTGVDLGIVNLYLDGVMIGEGIDLYTGIPAALLGAGMSSIVEAGTVTIFMPNVSLDAHRVKVVPTRTKNAGSAGYAAVYPTLRVMC